MEFVMNIILSSVRMATPLIFLALAELYSQRAGLVHIGLEGLASIGSLVGFLVSLITGSPMLGVLAGAAVGILVNMIFAHATVTLCAEQIVYGMAINIFAPALAAFIYRVYFGAGSELVQVGLMNTLSGSLGINVIGVKYAACVICGALAGIGGAYLTTCYANTYVDGNVAGRGFIALAAVIFGRWSGAGVLLACLFFGFCDALQIRLQVGSFGVPYQFFQMIPYVATVVVLASIGMKKAGPKSSGKPYLKEER